MATQDPLDVTIQTYREHYDAYVAGTEPQLTPVFYAWMQHFISLLPPRARVLEIGAGFGRGATLCRDAGCNVLGTDVAEPAIDKLNDLGLKTAVYDFRDVPPEEWWRAFDGVLAIAVFLHAPRDVFVLALEHAVRCLKPGGVLAFSVKEGAGEEYSSHKVGGPRFFQYYTVEDMRSLLQTLPVEEVDVRSVKDHTWLQVLARKV